jgi:ABC-type branched-subunit amino acid transport system ATPase component
MDHPLTFAGTPPYSTRIWEIESMLLSMRKVFAGYGGGDVLRGVDLEIPAGSVTCIVGPNGAGKSTILRTVSGLLKPRAGHIFFNDQRLAGLSPRQVLEHGIVQVPQERSLFPEMTVRENVRMGGYILRDKALVQRRLDEVTEMFPVVKDRAADKAGSLSGGQQKIVEFARCLMLDPALVLLDEPSMGLDPKTLKQVFKMMTVMREAGKTILLVEQNARSGLRHSTYGVVMESGQVRLIGSADEVLHNPEIGHLYLGGMLAPV